MISICFRSLPLFWHLPMSTTLFILTMMSHSISIHCLLSLLYMNFLVDEHSCQCKLVFQLLSLLLLDSQQLYQREPQRFTQLEPKLFSQPKILLLFQQFFQCKLVCKWYFLYKLVSRLFSQQELTLFYQHIKHSQ